jgi:DNA-binding transcriptional MerR regulator
MLLTDNSLGLESSSDRTSLYPIEYLMDFGLKTSLRNLPLELSEVKAFLNLASEDPSKNIRIRTASPFILILIPILLPFRDRIKVEIEFNHSVKDNDQNKSGKHNLDELSTSHAIAHNKRFKELLEAAQALISHEIPVCFSRPAMSSLR